MAEPDVSELVRRLDTLSRDMALFVAEVHADRLLQAETYQRRDMYLALHTALAEDVSEIKKERKEEAGQRRQFTLWLVGLTTSVMISIGLALFNFIASRGGLH